MSDAIVAHVCAFVRLHAYLCTLHAQVSVGVYVQWIFLPAPSRCVNGLTNRIIMWVRAGGHVDIVDLLMAITLLCVVLSCSTLSLCLPQTALHHHDHGIMKKKVGCQVQDVPTCP